MPHAGSSPRRPLKVFAFDPSFGRTLGNHLTIEVADEPLRPGPVGRHLAVIDYDATNGRYYAPVDLDAREVLLRGGLDPTESDPRFHQQMVYAVASETIRRFEYALGRGIRWQFARRAGPDPERQRLRIFPHAMQEANAYYDRDLRALLFGYFPASELDAGASAPGQTVFTCLSYDIVAHETAHALVDSQRDFFMEATSVDAPAFHEAFADLVALFQHFGCEEALLAMIERTGGRIFRAAVAPDVAPDVGGPTILSELTTSNPFVELARQFGEAMGTRKALRSALGTPPNTDRLATLTGAHERGGVLVAAVFDAFFTVYVRRTRDLMRIARLGRDPAPGDEVHPLLAKRLAREAAKTADHFFNICVRALDYCPPVDIRLGDFLRALVTADHDLVPDDTHGYRAALVDAFRVRGIVPEGVTSLSEDALRWPGGVLGPADEPLRCEDLSYEVFDVGDSEVHRRRRRELNETNARLLHAFATANAARLGLAAGLPIQARRFHSVHRVGPDGRVHFALVAELTQRRDEPVVPLDPSLGTFPFRGGATVLFDRDGAMRYAVSKPIDDADRLERQRRYLLERLETHALAVYGDAPRVEPSLSFARLHRGY